MTRSDNASPDHADSEQPPLLPGLSGWLDHAAHYIGRLGCTVELTEKELEQRLAPHFPWTGCRLGFSLALDEPQLSVLPEGVLRLHLGLKVARGGFTGEGFLEMTGRLQYESDSGRFFIANVTVEQLELARWRRPLWPLRRALEPALSWYFQRHPIVELQPERQGHAVMKAVLDRIETRTGSLHLHLKLLRRGPG